MELSGKVKVPREWTVMSKTKDLNRYYTPKLRDLVNELLQAQEHREIALRDIKRRLFFQFDQYFDKWFQLLI